MARVWRDGQKRNVFIYRLLATGTIEEKIYQRQVAKQGLSGAVVDDKKGESSSATFSLEELRDLFTLRTDTNSETLDLIGRPGATTEAPETDKGLGRAGAAKKQLSMDELLNWKHFEPPFASDSMDDGFLEHAKEGSVSCVFMNCTDPTQAASTGVEIGPGMMSPGISLTPATNASVVDHGSSDEIVPVEDNAGQDGGTKTTIDNSLADEFAGSDDDELDADIEDLF
jgi:DNA repair and recombination protein RAD54B